MPIVPVPADAAPRALRFATAGPTTCDVGPSPQNPMGGCVNVAIVAADPVDAPVRPDSAGQFLHCLWKFAKPRVGVGRRRETVGNYQPPGVGAGDGLWVETDPGSFWVGSPASLWFVGGYPGDRYFVSVDASTPYDDEAANVARGHRVGGPSFQQLNVWEPGFQFSLTSRFVVPTNPDDPFPGFAPFPLPLPHHYTDIMVESGQIISQEATTGQVPLNPRGKIPLNSIATLYVSTGYYKLLGAL